MIRVAQQLTTAAFPPDADFETNTATNLLARMLDLPPPGEARSSSTAPGKNGAPRPFSREPDTFVERRAAVGAPASADVRLVHALRTDSAQTLSCGRPIGRVSPSCATRHHIEAPSSPIHGS
jgi:hypothetical protein